MAAKASAVSHHGDPEILGKATEGNATLIARPEALLKFEETQERNAYQSESLRQTGRTLKPLSVQNNAVATKKKGGLRKILFCGGDQENEGWVKVELEETKKAKFEKVPWNADLQCYLLSCIDHLERDGSDEPRLFAVSGSQEVIEEMRMQYMTPLAGDTDLHVACAVLKQAIRDAESPLIDIEGLQQWVLATAAKKNQRKDTKHREDPIIFAPAFKESHLYNTLQVVRAKSPRRAYVLGRFMNLLGDISARIEVTQMSSHNLALCLAPSLLHWNAYENEALLILGRMTAYVMDLIDDGRENAEKLNAYCRELEVYANLPSPSSRTNMSFQV